MNPGSTRTFYQARKALLFAAFAAPVLLLAGAWWLVSEVLLPPAVPDEGAGGDAVVQFVIHEKGLPRLPAAEQERFLVTQTARLSRDAAFREHFLREVRMSSPEDQKLLRSHLFGAFLPRLLRDALAFQTLTPERRAAFLDERIVAYNRMNPFRGSGLGKNDIWGPSPPDSSELLALFLSKVTEEQRQLITGFGAALAARIEAILLDPELKADFETRIAQPE